MIFSKEFNTKSSKVFLFLFFGKGGYLKYEFLKAEISEGIRGELHTS